MRKVKELVEEVMKEYMADSCVRPDSRITVNAYELRDKIASKIDEESVDKKEELESALQELDTAKDVIGNAEDTIRDLIKGI